MWEKISFLKIPFYMFFSGKVYRNRSRGVRRPVCHERFVALPRILPEEHLARGQRKYSLLWNLRIGFVQIPERIVPGWCIRETLLDKVATIRLPRMQLATTEPRERFAGSVLVMHRNGRRT